MERGGAKAQTNRKRFRDKRTSDVCGAGRRAVDRRKTVRFAGGSQQFSSSFLDQMRHRLARDHSEEIEEPILSFLAHKKVLDSDTVCSRYEPNGERGSKISNCIATLCRRRSGVNGGQNGTVDEVGSGVRRRARGGDNERKRKRR